MGILYFFLAILKAGVVVIYIPPPLLSLPPGVFSLSLIWRKRVSPGPTMVLTYSRRSNVKRKEIVSRGCQISSVGCML